MTIKIITKIPEKIIFETDIDVSLANAIRRSVSDIPTLAIDEVDIYKNDSALYDEIVAHRLGLVPLKNQKLKKGQILEYKLKIRGSEKITKVFSGDLGDDIVYPKIPITLLTDGQEVEIVAKARQGTGEEHAKYIPGLFYYKYLPKIEITSDGEKHKELSERYPDIFEFNNGKLKVKNAWACIIDDIKIGDIDGVKIEDTKKLVIIIESWGQIEAKNIFLEAIKQLNNNLSELSKLLK